MIVRAIIILLLLSLPSCRKSTEDVLVIADVAKIDASTRIVDSIIGDLIFSPVLYRVDDPVFHNLLAEGIRVLPGGKEIEISIKKGVRFHDGKEIAARDVAASLNRMMEENSYSKRMQGQIRVTVSNEFKLILECKSSLDDLNLLLSNVYIYYSNLTGSGPYKFAKWLENGVELAANDDYFEGKPKLKRIVYRYEPDERKRVNMLLKGEAGLLIWLSPKMAGFLKTDDRFYVKELPTEFYSAIFLNNKSTLFSDKALRKAVSMAIDRDGLIKKALKGGGVKTSTPFLPQIFHPENNAASTAYRPKEAIRLLKYSGWRDADGDGILEKNGKKLMFRLCYNSNVEEFKKMTDLISQYLFEVGMGVEAIPTDINESTDRNVESDSYDAILDSKSSHDGVNMVTWSSSSLKNTSHFNNMEMDSLLERLGEATDIEQKKGIYGRMQRIFEEEAPAVFLYNPLIYTAVNKRFKGAENLTGSAYSMYKIKDWSVNEDKDRSINEVFE